MRSVISTAAVAAGLLVLAAAPAANAQSAGFVGAGYSRVDQDFLGVDLNGDFYALEGAIRLGTPTLGGSIDGAIVHSRTEGYNQTAKMLTGHLNTRFGAVLVGGFAGMDDSSDLSLWGAGVETLIDFNDMAALYVQAGYGETNDLGFRNAQLHAARGDLRIYPIADLRLQLSAGYQEAKLMAGIKTDATLFGVEAEYRIPRTPVSLRAGYDKYKVDDLAFDADIFRVGARYTFGGTLRERDRAGASLGSVNRLFALDNLLR